MKASDEKRQGALISTEFIKKHLKWRKKHVRGDSRQLICMGMAGTLAEADYINRFLAEDSILVYMLGVHVLVFMHVFMYLEPDNENNTKRKYDLKAKGNNWKWIKKMAQRDSAF